MSTRKQFIAALAAFVGIGKAQFRASEQPYSFTLPTKGGGRCTLWEEEPGTSQFPSCRGKVRNNQCPVCGEMAKPYVRLMRDENDGFMRNCKGNPYNNLVVCDPPKMVPDGPEERIVRCAVCNAAFFQDAV